MNFIRRLSLALRILTGHVELPPVVQQTNADTEIPKIQSSPKKAKNKPGKNKLFSFRVDEELLKEFRDAAEATKTPVSALLRQFMKDYCTKEKKRLKTQKKALH